MTRDYDMLSEADKQLLEKTISKAMNEMLRLLYLAPSRGDSLHTYKYKAIASLSNYHNALTLYMLENHEEQDHDDKEQ